MPEGLRGILGGLGIEASMWRALVWDGKLTLWIAAVFLSILVHDMGHALAMRYYGIDSYIIPYLEHVISVREGRPIDSILVEFVLVIMLLISLFWALLNLLPVYPLDGGQIVRNIFGLFHPVAGLQYSLILSVITASGVALLGFSRQAPILGIMFALLAYSSFQVLQACSSRGGFGR